MTEDERKVYDFKFSYTEIVVGSVMALSEDEAKAFVSDEFGHAEDFEILAVYRKVTENLN